MWPLSIKRTGILICLASFASLLFYPFNALADPRTFPTPWDLYRNFPTQIRSLTTDEQALDFLRSLHGQSSKTTKSLQHKDSDSFPPPMEEAASTLMAALSLKGLLKEIQDSALHSTNKSPVFPQINAGKSLPWVLTKLPRHDFQEIHDLYTLLGKWAQIPIEPLPIDHYFNQYSSHYDQRYGPLSEDSSWITLFREGGPKAIDTKLSEFWSKPPTLELPGYTEDHLKQIYQHHYQTIRLVPLFERELLKQTIRMEEKMTKVSWDNWDLLQQWLDQQRKIADLRRLCGTWKWIVHNHQNHGDHKMTMTFSASLQSSTSYPSPSHVTVNGNTVYLQWIFPQGTQEDSLLLSKNDTLLEGTFTNSTGPYGTISGKRLSACPS